MPAVDWTPESGYPPHTPAGTLPWRPRGAGSHLGLTVILNAETEQFYCSTSASKGFKVQTIIFNCKCLGQNSIYFYLANIIIKTVKNYKIKLSQHLFF